MTIARTVADQAGIAAAIAQGLTPDEAILTVLKMRPNWNYAMAEQFVNYAMSQSGANVPSLED